MFEQATRKALRFNTVKGMLSVEDLWNMPLTSKSGFSLDDVAKAIYKQVKDADEVSFVEAPTAKNSMLQLQFDIVKHIIKVKMAENEERRLENENSAKKSKIAEIIARKQDKALEDMSIEELQKLV